MYVFLGSGMHSLLNWKNTLLCWVHSILLPIPKPNCCISTPCSWEDLLPSTILQRILLLHIYLEKMCEKSPAFSFVLFAFFAASSMAGMHGRLGIPNGLWSTIRPWPIQNWDVQAVGQCAHVHSSTCTSRVAQSYACMLVHMWQF